MKIFLSSLESNTSYNADCWLCNLDKLPFKLKWNLISYFYARGNSGKAKKGLLIRDNSELVLVDSGAHSFQKGAKHGIKTNWEKYTRQYAEWIQQFDRPNVLGYFEMDVDSIIGYERVLELRKILHAVTDKIIPVWHKNRGIADFKAMCKEYSGKKDEFIRMCDEYDYVAIGGIVSKEIMPTEYKYFPAFIREAHKRGTKVHGLGFSNSHWLPICHFDSIDSTSWTYGTRAGQIYHFIPKKGCQYIKCPKGRRTRPAVAIHNFVEWVKFSNWAETHL